MRYHSPNQFDSFFAGVFLIKAFPLSIIFPLFLFLSLAHSADFSFSRSQTVSASGGAWGLTVGWGSFNIGCHVNNSIYGTDIRQSSQLTDYMSFSNIVFASDIPCSRVLNFSYSTFYSGSGSYSSGANNCADRTPTIPFSWSGENPNPSLPRFTDCWRMFEATSTVTITVSFDIRNLDCNGADKDNPTLCPPTLPPCLTPLPFNSPSCKGSGNNAFWFAGSALGVFGVLSDFYDLYPDGSYSLQDYLPSDTIFRPDGSKCNAYEGGASGGRGAITFCKEGDFKEESSSSSTPSSSSSSTPSSSSSGVGVSSSSSGVGVSSSSAGVGGVSSSSAGVGGVSSSSDGSGGGVSSSDGSGGGVSSSSAGGGGVSSSASTPSECELNPMNPGCPEYCKLMPNRPECQGGGEGGSGGGCENLRNCDWARVDFQLLELGVAQQTRDELKRQTELIRNGYELDKNRNEVLQSILGALNSGNVEGAINSNGNATREAINALGDSLGSLRSGMGSGFGSLSGAINSEGNSTRGAIGEAAGGIIGAINSEGNSTRGVINDGTKSIVGTIDSTRGLLDKIFDFFKDFADTSKGNPSFDLQDTTTIKDNFDGNQIKAKFTQTLKQSGLDSTSFSFFGTGGNCPIIPMKFDTGVYGIKSDKDLDLCNVYGYNVAQTLRAFLWLSVLLTCFFMDLEVLRKGGH